MLAATLVGSGCSSSPGAPPPTLYSGVWISENSNRTAAVVSFKTDSTYTAGSLLLTSETSGDTEIEAGTFGVSGQTIVLVPKESSCEGPDPTYSLQYTIVDDTLILGSTSGETTYVLDTATPSGSATYGCFASNGAFVPGSIAPVNSCTLLGSACSSGAKPCCDGNICVQQATATICSVKCATNADCPGACCYPTQVAADGFCAVCPADAGQ